jgi:hypothetical protein
VTRGTRPKKPSSSRGFAREARGARGTGGSWGLKTKNRIFILFFPAGNNYQIFIFIFQASARMRTQPVCANSRLRLHGAEEGLEWEGRTDGRTDGRKEGGRVCIGADAGEGASG